MRSPLKRPDLDDAPRDPSMMRMVKEDSYDDGEALLLEQNFDMESKPSADDYVDEFGYNDPTSQEPQEQQVLQRAPAAPEPPSNDVRPPEASTNSAATKPAATNNGNGAPKTPKKPKREMNPDWKQVKETGAWGEVSKKDIVIAVVIAVVVIVGVVVGVVLGFQKNNDNEPSAPTPKGPTMAPTMIPPETELVYAVNAIDSSDYTYLYLKELPLTVEAYDGLMNDPTASPQERAMSWLLYEDARDISYEAGERWALASLYYYWKGDAWISAKNWLSSESACTWEHINCDTVTGKIQEITLESNNLVGTIPPEIALLNTTQALWLNNNTLSGPLPNEVFGSMPKLTILYLENNKLTGTISLDIRKNGALNSLFLQYNDITGDWPRLFCSFSSSEPAPITNFGIDCDQISCPQQGCCGPLNCYYDN